MKRKLRKRALLALCVGTVCQFSGACLTEWLNYIPVGMGFTLGADLTESLGLGSLLPGIGNTE
jgi:hypothetical protein